MRLYNLPSTLMCCHKAFAHIVALPAGSTEYFAATFPEHYKQATSAYSANMPDSYTKITFGDNVPGFEWGDKDRAALLVIQEWWGVNEEVKALAIQLGATGPYRVLIPDLYKGKVGLDAEEASHLLNNLDFKQALGEIKQAVAYLKETGSPKVAVVGFCMGGALAFAAAQHAGVVAAAPFYGTPSPDICQVEAIKVPILAQFGALDQHKGFSDAETAKATVEKIKAAGGDVDFHLYEHCDHQFFNAVLGEQGLALIKKGKFQLPDEAEVQHAFQRTIGFLAKHLLL